MLEVVLAGLLILVALLAAGAGTYGVYRLFTGRS